MGLTLKQIEDALCAVERRGRGVKHYAKAIKRARKKAGPGKERK